MNLIPNAISVVIPTYNRANLIKESIQSVLEQTLLPYEIIIVDDGSTDNTEEVVNSFNSPIIKFIKNTRKKGANGARNTGIISAKGEYIAFHDSDDIWFSDKLSKQLEALKLNRADLCFCSMLRIGHGERKKVPDFPIKNVSQELKLRSVISTQTILIKTEIAKSILFSEEIFRLQDWDFCLKIVDKIKFYHLPEILVHQRINESSISSQKNYFESYMVILKKFDCIVSDYRNIYYVINTSKIRVIVYLCKILSKLRGILN